MGLSDTLGAFLAGVMLAETKYRHQVEADIKPFRGLLLGLFFITVGFSIDVRLLWANLSTVTSLIGGLLALKVSTCSFNASIATQVQVITISCHPSVGSYRCFIGKILFMTG